MTQQRKDIVLLESAIRALSGKGVDNVIHMLRQYQESVNTAFSEWMRTNREIDSRTFGLSIQNIDWVIHQYKTAEDKNGIRDINNLMLIEEKRFFQAMNFAQDDTLACVLDQCLGKSHKCRVTNRRGRSVIVRYFGLHLLQFSGSGPEDSLQIFWDGKAIDKDKLTRLIRFELDPRTLRVRDVGERRHHANKGGINPLFDNIAP